MFRPSSPARPALFPAPYLAILVVCVALGALLRLFPIAQRPLWLDEGYTFWFSEQSFRFLWQEMPKGETFPPLYYSLVKLWREVAGSSEAALRFPSAVAGILIIPVLALAGRLAGGGRHGPALGVMAAAVAALWQFLIDYSMEVRPYALSALAVAVMMAGTFQILAHPGALRRPWGAFLREERAALLGLLGMGGGIGLVMWTHLMGAIPSLIVGAYLIGWWIVHERGHLRVFSKLMAGALFAVVLHVPNTLFFHSVLTRDASSFWLKAPELWQLAQMTADVYGQRVAARFPLTVHVLLTATVIIAGLVGYWRVTRRPGEGGTAIFVLTILMAVGHWLGMVALTYLYQPALVPRTLIFGVPPTILVVAALPWCRLSVAGVGGPGMRGLSRAQGVLAALLLAYLAIGSVTLPPDRLERPRFDQMVATIAGSDESRAPVFVFPGQYKTVIDYYTMRQGVALDVRGYPFALPDFTMRPQLIGAFPIRHYHLADLAAQVGGLEDLWLVFAQPGQTGADRIFEALAMAGLQWEVVIGGDKIPTLYRVTRRAEATGVSSR